MGSMFTGAPGTPDRDVLGLTTQAWVRRVLEFAMPPGIAVGVCVISDPRHEASLWPEERVYVRNANPPRCAEFAAGRAAAREAMALGGLAAQPIRVDEDGAPVWPAGVVGSLAHTGNVAVALVGSSSTFTAIGIDVETPCAVPRRLWADIFTASEQVALGELAAERRDKAATLMFSAKEAFFKFQFPRTRQRLDFADIEVCLDRWENRQPMPFTCRVAVPLTLAMQTGTKWEGSGFLGPAVVTALIR